LQKQPSRGYEEHHRQSDRQAKAIQSQIERKAQNLAAARQSAKNVGGEMAVAHGKVVRNTELSPSKK
jgi:hypothetical protein